MPGMKIGRTALLREITSGIMRRVWMSVNHLRVQKDFDKGLLKWEERISFAVPEDMWALDFFQEQKGTCAGMS